ncbi:MAG: flagellar hook-associated protein FlgL [Gemmatimonadota bacterium]
MRISNSLIQQRTLRDLQRNLQAMTTVQQQISSGKRFERISEDPLGGTQVMGVDQALKGIAQYRRNSSTARARNDTEESVLNQVTDLLTRSKELALQEGTATATTATHQAAAAEVDSIIQQVIALGNTQIGTEHIFGGNQTGATPFDPTGTYLGDDGVRQAEVGQGYLLQTNHTGRQLLVNSGVLQSLQDLKTQLTSGTTSSIGSTASGIDAAFQQTQVLLADTGARTRQIDSAMQNSDALESNLTIRKSGIQDMAIDQATTQFVGLQTTLQAALLSAQRVLNTSLTDYLR